MINGRTGVTLISFVTECANSYSFLLNIVLWPVIFFNVKRQIVSRGFLLKFSILVEFFFKGHFQDASLLSKAFRLLVEYFTAGDPSFMMFLFSRNGIREKIEFLMRRGDSFIAGNKCAGRKLKDEIVSCRGTEIYLRWQNLSLCRNEKWVKFGRRIQ